MQRVPGLVWACLEHWWTLSPQIRGEIMAHHREPGPSASFLEFAQEHAFAHWDGLERAGHSETSNQPATLNSLEAFAREMTRSRRRDR
jgi:hypothetical protein